MITSIITAIVVGLIIGALARLIIPGKQKIGILLTIIVGIIAAFVGTAIAKAVGVPTQTSGIDWLELAIQVVVAIVGVAIVAGIMGRRSVRR